MQLSRVIVAAIMLVAGGGLWGCSGASPFSAQPGSAFSTSGGFDHSSPQLSDQLAQAFPQQNSFGQSGSQMPVQPSTSRSESPWWASLRGVGATFQEAFAITPQTIPAPDPTSLSSQPGDVGGALNYHAAKVYENEGNTAGAMALYQKALQMTPDDVRSMIGYARLLDREGNFREAERLYRRAIELDGDNVVAWNDLGMIYARQGMFDPAVESLNQAIERQPRNLRYRNNMAIVLIDAGRPDEAFAHLAAVHGDAAAHYNLGFLLARRNKRDRAVGHLQQALALNPQLSSARRLLDSLATPPVGAQHAVAQPPRDVSGYPISAQPVSVYPAADSPAAGYPATDAAGYPGTNHMGYPATGHAANPQLAPRSGQSVPTRHLPPL